MNRIFFILIVGFALSLTTIRAQSIYSDHSNEYHSVNIDVWLDKNDGAIYHPAENIEIYFRANSDCYAVIYDIDTDGRTKILFPQYPDDGFIQANQTYRLPDYYDHNTLRVNGRRGVEYIQAIATTQPNSLRYLYDHGIYRLGVDYITGDPFESINQINNRLIDPSYIHGSATTYFFVEGYVWYPRYLCTGCHSNSYTRFDPYIDVCPQYQIITVHNYDYWWGCDYYPQRVRFVFAGPFWRWEMRHGNFYRPWRTSSYFEIAFGHGNFYTPAPPRHAYIERDRTDYRYRRFSQYEREYRPEETRYRSRTFGDTRNNPSGSNRSRLSSDDRTRNNSERERIQYTPTPDRISRDRSSETRIDPRTIIQTDRSRDVNRNNDINIGNQRSTQREQNEGNLSRDRIRSTNRSSEPIVRPNIERTRNENSTQMRDRSSSSRSQSSRDIERNRSGNNNAQVEQNESSRSRGR